MSGKVLKNSAIYTFVTLLQRSVGFLLLPFYTFYLNPGEYGNLSVILSISNFVSILILLAIPYATARFNFALNNDEQKLKVLWGNNLMLILLSTAIIGTCLIIFHKTLVDPFSKGISFYPYLLIAIVTTLLNPLYVFYQSYLQTGQQGKRYGVNLTLNFIINNCLILLFVMQFKMGILGILLANLITTFLFALYTLIVFLPKVKLAMQREQSKETLKYSLPLIPHTLSFWIVNMMDRIFLNNLNSSAATGIYSVGNQIGSTINVVTSSVNQAYSPWFYNVVKDPANTSKVIKMTNTLSFLYCLVALAIAFFSREIILVLATGKYENAWKVIPLIAFGCVFLGYYHFFANVILLEKRTKYLAVASISSALLSVTANAILIPSLGGIGAAISSVISYFLTSLLAFIMARKFRPDIRFALLRMYGTLILFFAIALIAYLENFVNFYLFILLKTAIYAAIVGYFISKNRQEAKIILSRLKIRISKFKGVGLANN